MGRHYNPAPLRHRKGRFARSRKMAGANNEGGGRHERALPETKFDDAGSTAYDEPMDRRVTRIEAFVAEANERFAAIEARLDRIEARLDKLREMILSTRWIIGTMLAVSTVGIGIITFVINNGAGRAGSAATQPIVIYVQPPAQPAAAANQR